MFDDEKVTKAVSLLLEGFGEDVEREGLKETPRRVCSYWKELLQGNQYTNEQIAEMFGKKFLVPANPLVVKKIDNVYSHCEHHLALMYNMSVVVAYLPKEVSNGWYEVIGLSKIPRIVDLCSKRLQLQEQLAEDIAQCISLATGSEHVYVNVIADHACVSARGAKSQGTTDVTCLKGRFLTDTKLRDEIERKCK